MLGTTDVTLFNDETWDWEDVTVLFVRIFGTLRRLKTSPTSTIDNSDLPLSWTVRALPFGRSFAKLEDLRIVHVGDQLLQFFAELFNLARPIQERHLVRVTVELLNQLLDRLCAICFLLLDYGKRNARNPVVSVSATGFSVAQLRLTLVV